MEQERFKEIWDYAEYGNILSIEQSMLQECLTEIGRLQKELADERGAHAMTKQNFTDYAEDKAVEVAALMADITVCCDTCRRDILAENCHTPINGECVNWRWRGMVNADG